MDSDGDTLHSCLILARLKSGREVKLLPENSELEVTRAVEQLVEAHPKICDEAPPGEDPV